jgi:proliferating cell nuclear antigen PCNA
MRLFELVTEHGLPFRTVFEVLKEVLQEANIDVRAESSSDKNKKLKQTEEETEQDDAEADEDGGDTEDNKKDKGGLKIMAVDTTKTVLINLKLDAKNFNKFKCTKKKLSIGVNLGLFYKTIKSMDKNDILTLYVDHDDKNYLGIKIDNEEEKKDSIFRLKLLDLDDHKMQLPDTRFDAVVTMNSTEFHKLCREMSQLAEYVEIKCLKDKIIFTCKGDFADRTTTYKGSTQDEETDVFIKHASTSADDAPEIVQGIYELKNLVLFSKCASLCNDIEIYMKNDYPLIIKYTVATLGRILLGLTPINEDTTKNANYSDEDEYYSDEEIKPNTTTKSSSVTKPSQAPTKPSSVPQKPNVVPPKPATSAKPTGKVGM